MPDKLCQASSFGSLCSSVAAVPSAGAEALHRSSGVAFSLHVLPFHKVIVHGLVLPLQTGREGLSLVDGGEGLVIYVSGTNQV